MPKPVVPCELVGGRIEETSAVPSTVERGTVDCGA